jgi:DnaJ like chaperone protein
MFPIGALIGAAIGFKAGGFLGVLLGWWLGNKLQNWLADEFGSGSPKTRIQNAYFKALFLSLGKLAKADGRVSEEEIVRARRIMQRMNLSEQQKKQAIHLFNQGKQPGFDIRPAVAEFAQLAARSFSLKQMFVEMLLDAAAADGQIKPEEWQVLLVVAELLGIPRPIFIMLAQMRGFSYQPGRASGAGQGRSYQYQGGYGGYSGGFRPQPQREDPYRVLGVRREDSRATIRKAYKKLMSQHHPDKLMSKGLPPEMVEIAKEKTQKITAAWEQIEKERGW